MAIYVLRVTMLAPSRGVQHQPKLDAVFDLLDEQGVGEDLSGLDESGRFNVWLHVVADSPQDALVQALEALNRADVSVAGERLGSIVGIDIQFEQTAEDVPATPVYATR